MWVHQNTCTHSVVDRAVSSSLGPCVRVELSANALETREHVPLVLTVGSTGDVLADPADVPKSVQRSGSALSEVSQTNEMRMIT